MFPFQQINRKRIDRDVVPIPQAQIEKMRLIGDNGMVHLFREPPLVRGLAAPQHYYTVCGQILCAEIPPQQR